MASGTNITMIRRRHYDCTSYSIHIWTLDVHTLFFERFIKVEPSADVAARRLGFLRHTIIQQYAVQKYMLTPHMYSWKKNLQCIRTIKWLVGTNIFGMKVWLKIFIFYTQVLRNVQVLPF